MSENWEPGDLALCVLEQEDWPAEVQPGSIHTVGAVWHNIPNWHDPEELCTCLDLVGVRRMNEGTDDEASYCALAFVKIKPREADEFDREVIAAMAGQTEQVPT